MPKKTLTKTQNGEKITMIRKAVIIGSPFDPKDDDLYLPGVELDISNYKMFLKSPLGGYWSDSEIEVLRNPKKTEVKNALNKILHAEYTIVVFCGHGAHSIKGNSTIISINQNENLNSSDLKSSNQKRTIILDCCRTKVDSLALESFSAALAKFHKVLDGDECRKYYNQRIRECDVSQIVLYGCSIGQESNESSELGGHYSSSLISSAKAWLDGDDTNTETDFNILSVVMAHEKAKQDVMKMSSNKQIPQIDRPRSGKIFPFSVIA